MRTLVLANQKGGVGKSAIACQLAHFLVRSGKRVLFLDLDHQQNSSRSLRLHVGATLAPFSASDLLWERSGELKSCQLAVVPGDEQLSALERQPDHHNRFVNALKTFLDTVGSHFDACIIDTNPNPDIRYAAALIAANFLLSPVQLNQEAIDGIGALLSHKRYGFRKIKATLNPKLHLIGILPNMVEATPFQRTNFKQLAEIHAGLLISLDPPAAPFAFIPTRTAMAEAQASGEFLADMKKTSARDAWREIRPSFEAIAAHLS